MRLTESRKTFKKILNEDKSEYDLVNDLADVLYDVFKFAKGGKHAANMLLDAFPLATEDYSSEEEYSKFEKELKRNL